MVKSNSEYKSIQKKLVAAVAMVLVASIMVVTSSYAWFTLSTAPEVTGISTSVGSNGNLEIALRTDSTEVPKTGTNVEYPLSNTYWGNLLDMSDSSYHFDSLSLRPARLNAVRDTANSQTRQVQKTLTVYCWAPAAGGENYWAEQKQADGDTEVQNAAGTAQDSKVLPVWKPAEGDEYAADQKRDTNDTAVMVTEDVLVFYKFATGGYLQTPVYGADGRVSQLTPNTTNGVYNETNKAFAEDGTGNLRGVRAVGTTANISPAELALRNAKQAVNSAISSSKTNATISLRDDSVKLANIIVANALDADATYTKDDKAVIQAAINNLKDITTSLENALKQAVVAVGVSKGLSFTADKVSFDGGIIAVDGVGNDALWGTEGSLLTRKAEIEGYVVTLNDMVTKLTGAQNKLNAITKETGITFTEISEPLITLLTTDDFTITNPDNGVAYTIAGFKELGLLNMAKIMLKTPTVTIVNGIYKDIATFSGNYSVTTSMKVTGTFPDPIGAMNEDVSVVMATAAAEPFYLPTIQGWMGQLSAQEGGSVAALLTDIYGYAVDMAFRTNAAGSSLLLQTEAKNRVEDSAVTQGGGSYMQFKSGHADFTLLQVADLMESIRVVFTNDAGTIFGIAVPDVSYEYLMDGGANVTFVAGTADHDYNDNGNAVNFTSGTVDGEYIKAPLKLVNYTVEEGGKITVSSFKTDAVITDLVQNTAEYISALVFLDGDMVENSDVAIAGNSMTGTMNLQFASSAELDPMDYTFQTTKLAKPASASIDGDKKLTIASVEGAASYKLNYDGRTLGTIEAVGTENVVQDVSAVIDALPAGLANREITLSVIAVPEANSGKTESDAFEFTYTVPATPEGT